MNDRRGLKQKLLTVSRLWREKDYDRALAEVESLRKTWPGNARLHILWASLVQLQENPQHDLDEAKRALQQAVELDKGSAAAVLELGHFLIPWKTIRERPPSSMPKGCPPRGTSSSTA